MNQINDIDWDAKVRQINELHKELQQKPPEQRRGFQFTVAGILNAYREGDIPFDIVRDLLRVNPPTIEALGEGEYES